MTAAGVRRAVGFVRSVASRVMLLAPHETHCNLHMHPLRTSKTCTVLLAFGLWPSHGWDPVEVRAVPAPGLLHGLITPTASC